MIDFGGYYAIKLSTMRQNLNHRRAMMDYALTHGTQQDSDLVAFFICYMEYVQDPSKKKAQKIMFKFFTGGANLGGGRMSHDLSGLVTPGTLQALKQNMFDDVSTQLCRTSRKKLALRRRAPQDLFDAVVTELTATNSVADILFQAANNAGLNPGNFTAPLNPANYAPPAFVSLTNLRKTLAQPLANGLDSSFPRPDLIGL
jgi:hypothetical protein